MIKLLKSFALDCLARLLRRPGLWFFRQYAEWCRRSLPEWNIRRALSNNSPRWVSACENARGFLQVWDQIQPYLPRETKKPEDSVVLGPLHRP